VDLLGGNKVNKIILIVLYIIESVYQAKEQKIPQKSGQKMKGGGEQTTTKAGADAQPPNGRGWVGRGRIKGGKSCEALGKGGGVQEWWFGGAGAE
jgi:hypothetical protein